MNASDRFEGLAAAARSDLAPGVNVSGRVLSALAQGHARCILSDERPLMWLAAISSVAAIPAAVLSVFVYRSVSNPLVEVLDVIYWAM